MLVQQHGKISKANSRISNPTESAPQTHTPCSSFNQAELEDIARFIALAMASSHQWKLVQIIKSVENRLCVDCAVPLTSNEAFGTSYGTWVCGQCAQVHLK